MATLLLFVFLLLLFSGLASMTEAALFSVPLSRVHLAVEQHERSAHRLLRIKEDLRRPIATIVILNNAINIVGSIWVGQLSVQLFGSGGETTDRVLGTVSACLTFLVILFAEIVPKNVGERFCDSVALKAAGPVLFLTRALLPLLWLIEWITKPLQVKENNTVGGEEEISILAKVADQTGEISTEESELIHRAFRLNDVLAKDIMTHRVKLSFLSPETKLGDLRNEDLHHEYSRILVADGDLDRVTGLVYLRDILLALAEGRRDETIKSLTQPVTRVYEGTPSHELLQKFQRTRQHLFVVGDEYGGTSGVVTLEDVLEELVGEIEDEHDVPTSPAGSMPVETPSHDRRSRAATQIGDEVSSEVPDGHASQSSAAKSK
ncbi:MAG: hemolysin family protein [Planctomycetes bacterium]|nr:hemolysin family protein [Planctomycetota bacterium]